MDGCRRNALRSPHGVECPQKLAQLVQQEQQQQQWFMCRRPQDEINGPVNVGNALGIFFKGVSAFPFRSDR